MITITTLNEQKKFENGVNGFKIVDSIFSSIASEVVAIVVNDEVYDLSRPLFHDSNISIIKKNTDEALEIIRHDAAHIMAQAVKELFKNVKVAIGPTVKDGFYYDFDAKHTFSTKDFALIERKMEEIIDRNEKFVRKVWSRKKAVEFFQSIEENYKVEILQRIPEDEYITIYQQGDFIDLCRGPHGPSTKIPKAFKLMKVAGAYWKGDSNLPMLQRIYATAWHNKTELDSYIKYLEEIEKRDHRKIAKEMDLFHIQNEAGGQIFWHANGWTLYCILKEYIRKKLALNQYIEVNTPILVDRSLWEKSGHWEKFRENMFVAKNEEETLAIKPMNCPCHVQIFNYSIKSYRDLPIRMSEFGTCHRNESSGSLYGLMRVRGFVQDDAHIFCTEEQIVSETLNFCQLLKEIYKELGFTEVLVKFSDRPDNKAGDNELWNKAENSLKEAIEAANLTYTLNPGEGAFYGPKLEFILRDAIGREWQCGTLQMDFILPTRLGAQYVGKDGKKHYVVMLHRAILGTFERFIGILLEHYSGKLPLWMSPIQLIIITINSECNEYAKELLSKAKKFHIRAEFDLTSEKIGYKIRYHSVRKVPVLWIIGKNELEMQSVSVRTFGSSLQKSLSIEQAMQDLLSQTAL